MGFTLLGNQAFTSYKFNQLIAIDFKILFLIENSLEMRQKQQPGYNEPRLERTLVITNNFCRSRAVRYNRV